MQHPDRFGPLLQRARALKFEGKHDEALVILEQILMNDPTCTEALEEVADNELSMGHRDRAERAARSVLALNPQSCNAHYIMGFVYSEGEQWLPSVEHLKKANSLQPNDAEILRCLGWSLFSSGQEMQGVVTIERSLNLDRDNPLTLCDLGVIYLKLHDMPKAIQLLQRAIDIDPMSDRAKECLAMAKRISELSA